MVVKIEEKVVITNSSEAKNLNENEYFTAYFNDVKYGMNDEIREDLHFEMAPCEPEEFLRAYVEKDPDFEELLNSEFSIEL